jgi:TRAP-type mannitol/chloroaromatic compound transport system permease large subunit
MSQLLISAIDGLVSFLPAISGEWIGVWMIAAMLFAIFLGFPISFTLIFLGVFFGAWGFGMKLTIFLMQFQIYGSMMEQTLAAVPLFVFMGFMMEQAGLMERLFSAVQLLLARMKGSLYIAVLFVSVIFGAATGIVGASVTILGIMAATTMNRSGYDVRLAAGTITAGGTLGILIPPSIMLVVMGPVLEVPVTDLFAAAIIPGIMMAFLYAGYALARCWINPSLGAPLPESEIPYPVGKLSSESLVIIPWCALMIAVPIFILGKAPGILEWGPLGYLQSQLAYLLAFAIIFAVLLAISWVVRAKLAGEGDDSYFAFSEVWKELFLGMVPPSILIAFAMGSILAGWATPTEGAGMGAFGSVILAMMYRKFTFKSTYDALLKTLEISVLILFLVAASNFFGAVFSRLGTPQMITELLLGLDLSAGWIIVLILALVFVLGWPLEWVPIVLIILPILVPVLTALNVDMVWFAILVAVCLQTAWLSPPVALSAYFLKGVVPEWDLKDIYYGMMQFMVIQIIGLGLVFLFPAIATWLPKYLYGN